MKPFYKSKTFWAIIAIIVGDALTYFGEGGDLAGVWPHLVSLGGAAVAAYARIVDGQPLSIKSVPRLEK